MFCLATALAEMAIYNVPSWNVCDGSCTAANEESPRGTWGTTSLLVAVGTCEVRTTVGPLAGSRGTSVLLSRDAAASGTLAGSVGTISGLLCLAAVTGGVCTAIGVQAGTVDAMGLLCLAAVTG